MECHAWKPKTRPCSSHARGTPISLELQINACRGSPPSTASRCCAGVNALTGVSATSIKGDDRAEPASIDLRIAGRFLSPACPLRPSTQPLSFSDHPLLTTAGRRLPVPWRLKHPRTTAILLLLRYLYFNPSTIYLTTPVLHANG